MHSLIAPDFLQALQDLAGSAVEVEFERIGDGFSTYPLHGQIIGVDVAAAQLKLMRTRTHTGQLHEMGLRYFLHATTPDGTRYSNRYALEHLRQRRSWLDARESTRLSIKTEATSRPRRTETLSSFLGGGVGTFPGYPKRRFAFADRQTPSRTVSIIAKSQAHARHFMAAQDAFMTLDESLVVAISAHVLWPAGIAFDRQVDPQAWQVPWLEIFDELDGLSATSLEYYLGRFHRQSASSRTVTLQAPSTVDSLVARGLLQLETLPTTPQDMLARVSIKGLQELQLAAGIVAPASSRGAIVRQLLNAMSPQLEAEVRKAMRRPLGTFTAPCGLSMEEFGQAIRVMRDSLFLMRQWMRAERELYRESDLQAISATL